MPEASPHGEPASTTDQDRDQESEPDEHAAAPTEHAPPLRAQLADDAAAALARMGAAKFHAHEHAEAEQLLERALELFDRTPHAEWSQTVQALNTLAALCIAQGRLDDAEPRLRRALAITERELGLEHPDVAYFLNNLAHLYLKRRQFYLAERLLLRLLAIQRKQGENDPEVATALASLALAREGAGEIVDAQELWRRALAIRETTLPADSPVIALSLEHLADSCAATGDVAEALALRERALAIRERTLGPDHAGLAAARARLVALRSGGDKPRAARDGKKPAASRTTLNGATPPAPPAEGSAVAATASAPPRTVTPDTPPSARPSAAAAAPPAAPLPDEAPGSAQSRPSEPARDGQRPPDARPRARPARPATSELLRAVAARDATRAGGGASLLGRARELFGPRPRDASAATPHVDADADDSPSRQGNAGQAGDREVPTVPTHELLVPRRRPANPVPGRTGNGAAPAPADVVRPQPKPAPPPEAAETKPDGAAPAATSHRYDPFSDSAWPTTRLVCIVGTAVATSVLGFAVVNRLGGAWQPRGESAAAAAPAPAAAFATGPEDRSRVAVPSAEAPATAERTSAAAGSLAPATEASAASRVAAASGGEDRAGVRATPRKPTAPPSATTPADLQGRAPAPVAQPPVASLLEDATRAIDSVARADGRARRTQRQPFWQRLPFLGSRLKPRGAGRP